MIPVTVIVCSYRRPILLQGCLQSLQNQSLDSIEIVAVDNAADPAVEQRIRSFNATARIPVQYVPEPRLGLHFARHAGAHAAHSDLLLYTDDDAVFDPEWSARYATAFASHPEMAAAGGPVRPHWETPPPAWLLALVQSSNVFAPLSLMEPFSEFRLGGGTFFFGVNMAIRREALFAAGGFNPELEADVSIGDGESGLHAKLLRRGMLVGYVPDAIVFHRVPTERMTLEYLCGPYVNAAVCDTYSRFQERMPGRPGLIRECADALSRYVVFATLARVVRGRTDPRSIYIQQRAMFYRSKTSYIATLLRDSTVRRAVSEEQWL